MVQNHTIRWPVLLGLAFWLLMPALVLGQDSVGSIREQIRHAETCYWYGMTERGNLDAFRKGLAFLHTAEGMLKSSKDFPAQDAAGLEEEIHALRSDLQHQIHMHRNTLYGVFPLVRFFAAGPFADTGATDTFELTDESDEVAVAMAASSLAARVLEKWSSRPQLHVVFHSHPPNDAMENEALYVFSLSPKFFVHNAREAAAGLSPGERARYERGDATPEMIQALMNALQLPDLLLVGVRLADVMDRDYRYVLEGILYENGREEPTSRLLAMGFSRDRRPQLPFILAAQIALYLMAMAAFFILTGKKRDHLLNPRSWVLPTVGFAIGRVLPWALLTMVSKAAPAPETLAKLAFWWPCLVGLVLFVAPLLGVQILSTRLKGLAPFFKMEGREGPIFVTAAMGACAFLTRPLFLYLEGSAMALLPPLILAAGAASYWLGRLLDDDAPLPLATAPIAILSLCGLGPAIAHLNPVFVWMAAGLALSPLVFVFIGDRVKTQQTILSVPHRADQAVAMVPQTLEGLKDQAMRPPYVELPFFNRVFEMVQPLFASRTCWVFLTGPRGSGKTAAADHLLRKVEEMLAAGGKKVRALRGECPPGNPGETSDITPYAPFQTAFASLLNINPKEPPWDQILRLACKLTDALGYAIPIPGFLFPSGEGRPNPASNQKEVFASVEKMIRENTRESAAILFLDDVQWLDPASRDLLTYLYSAFPPDQETPLLVILASLDQGALNALSSRKKAHRKPGLVELTIPPIQEQSRILTESLGLAPEVADDIVQQVGLGPGEEGGLSWLFRVVFHLTEQGFLKRAERAFFWSDKHEARKPLPFPGDYREAIAHELERIAESRPIVECAACHGLAFYASILAESLNEDRLRLLQALHGIEKETGLIYDVRDTDDLYAFRSPLVLEVVRQHIGITGKGPLARDVPQVVREYHARLARCLEKGLDRDPKRVYDVARHYYAAGVLYSQEALDACLRAADAARREFLYDQARSLVNMARQCIEALGRPVALEAEGLLIDLDQAHVENREHGEAARKGLQLLQAHPDAPFKVKIAVVRACYDAGGATRDQVYFQEAVRLGKEILAQTVSDRERAEALHFIGISLPLSDWKGRSEHLKEAMSLLDAAPENDLSAQALRGRVANSLAEQLSYDPGRDPAEAKRLFEVSLCIKSRPEIRDLPGLARTHGGLGRLARAEGDIPRAKGHFEEDLRLSEELRDIGGQAQMQSHLAECCLAENDLGAALNCYEKSLELSESPRNRLFALTGILEVALALNGETAMKEASEGLIELGEKMPATLKDCAARILDALSNSPSFSSESWHTRLKSLAKEALLK